jgi:hypothetical protein
MSYWEEWKKKVDALEKEIHSLIMADEKTGLLEEKFIEYDRLIAESIPY